MATTREPRAPDVVAAFDADYWDAFRIADLDGARPAQWAAAALSGSEVAGRAFGTLVWHHALSFDLAPPGTPGTLVGWTVSTDTDDEYVMGVEGSRTSARMVFARDGADLVWTTMLRHHGRIGAPTWAVLGKAHRALAPRCLDLARRSLARKP